MVGVVRLVEAVCIWAEPGVAVPPAEDAEYEHRGFLFPVRYIRRHRVYNLSLRLSEVNPMEDIPLATFKTAAFATLFIAALTFIGFVVVWPKR
jgi:hypothetical protein